MDLYIHFDSFLHHFQLSNCNYNCKVIIGSLAIVIIIKLVLHLSLYIVIYFLLRLNYSLNYLKSVGINDYRCELNNLLSCLLVNLLFEKLEVRHLHLGSTFQIFHLGSQSTWGRFYFMADLGSVETVGKQDLWILKFVI